MEIQKFQVVDFEGVKTDHILADAATLIRTGKG
jgi:hypothetical protein